jgi:outer membrane protein, heavy metal efflux system
MRKLPGCTSLRFVHLALTLIISVSSVTAAPLSTDALAKSRLDDEDLMPESKALLKGELELSKNNSRKSSIHMDLNQVVERALISDPAILAGYETIRQAEADLVTAGLLPNPSLVADYLMVPWGKAWTPTRQGGPTQTDELVYMPIDWLIFGTRTAAIVAAQKGVDVSSAQYADLVRTRIGGVISAYYDVLEARTLLEFAHENLDRVNEVRARHQKNGGEALDAERIRLALFTIHRDIRTRHMEYSNALATLRAFLGYLDDTRVLVDGDLKIQLPMDPPSVDEVYELAVEHRPDILAAQHMIAHADSQIELEERRAFPKISPGFGYTKQFQAEMAQANASSWNVMVNMNIPIFDRNQGNIEKANSIKIQTVHQKSTLLIDLKTEVIKAVKTFDNAWLALTIDDPGRLEASRTVLDQITQEYEAGKRPLIDVLDAIRTFSETYRLHIAAHSGYWHSIYQLNTVIGYPVYR